MIAERIAGEFGLPEEYVMLVARTASYRYKTYEIEKRSGGKRTINHPSRELKLFQRWIVKNVFARLPVHRSAFAYKRRCGIYKNAHLHRKRNYLLRVDFRDFFRRSEGRTSRHFCGGVAGCWRKQSLGRQTCK
jgi:RNA-directed DNA polymerase